MFSFIKKLFAEPAKTKHEVFLEERLRANEENFKMVFLDNEKKIAALKLRIKQLEGGEK